jgi:hypothetical protein
MFANDSRQLIGPVAVIATVACAEFSAYALGTWPSSSILWYLNLEVFRPVEYSFGFEEKLVSGGLAQSLCLVVSFLGLICTGLIIKSRFLLALASNLSLLYSALLLLACAVANNPFVQTSSKLSGLWGPSFLLATFVFLGSLLSSAESHRGYWREIFP